MELINYIDIVGKERAFEVLRQEPYNLQIDQHPKYGWYMFYYTMRETDMSYTISKECRGVILNCDCTEVICRPMDKTFNYNEPNAYPVDFSKSIILEKVDGSFLNVFYDDDKWHIKLNKNFDCKCNIMFPTDEFKTFDDIIADIIDINTLYDVLSETKNVNKEFTFMFEITHPLNMIVVQSDPELVFLGMRHNKTGIEYSQIHGGFQYIAKKLEKLGIRTPRHFKLDRIDIPKLMDVTQSYNKEKVTLEGFMVCQVNRMGYIDGRVKVKDPKYLNFHKMQDPATAKNTYYLVFRDNEQEEFEAYLQDAPEYLKREYYKLKVFWIDIEKEFKKYTEQFTAMYKKEVDIQGETEGRKQIALYIRDHVPKYMQSFLLTMVFNNLTLYDVLSQKQSHKPVKRLIDNYKKYTKKERESDI